MIGNRTTTVVAAADLPNSAKDLVAQGYRLSLVSAQEDPDGLRVVYLFTAGRPDRRVELVLGTDRVAPTVPSLTAVSFSAGRFEREMRDMYGITPHDHPMPRRLVRHQHWPQGWYPMRSDAGPAPTFGSTDAAFPFVNVSGDGVYEIPVGPVHAGLIGSGHFRFSVVGETILKMKARLWFTHRGIEKLAEGRSLTEAAELAARVCGDTTVGHTLAYSLAVEDALDCSVPAPAAILRIILVELERLYNHVGTLGGLCTDVGHSVLDNHAMRVREQLLRLNDRLTGHRLLRGAVFPGGAQMHSLPDAAELSAVADEVAQIVALALRNSTIRDRFTGTAVLTAEHATELGALGPVARGSGVDHDARHDHPFTAQLDTVGSTTRTSGDVLARFLVRADEVRHSIDLIQRVLPLATAGTFHTTLTPHGAPASGIGLVEGSRGTIAHRVEITGAVLTRLKIVDPSFLTWPALPVALTDTIVPDFPLANKSFNLSYAGNDL